MTPSTDFSQLLMAVLILSFLGLAGLYQIFVGLKGLFSKGNFLTYEVRPFMKLWELIAGKGAADRSRRGYLAVQRPMALLALLSGIIAIILLAVVLYRMATTEWAAPHQPASSDCYYPLNVSAEVSPPPVVGREVIWHIVIAACGQDMRDTRLEARLPEGVAFISGEPNWQGDILAGKAASIDLVIRVDIQGEWAIDAAAFSHSPSDPSVKYAAASRLYITSSTSYGAVEDLVDRLKDDPWVGPGTPIPDSSSGPVIEPPGTP